MSTVLCLVCSMVALLPLSGASYVQLGLDSKGVLVATISSEEYAIEHVLGTLHRSGIRASASGSLAFGVRVTGTNEKEAIHILAEDAKTFAHLYHSIGMGSATKHIQLKKSFLAIKTSIRDAGSNKQLALDPLLLKGLSFCIKSEARLRQSAGGTLSSIEWEERPYRARDGRKLVAYAIWFRFLVDHRRATIITSVYDNGKKVSITGAWWSGPSPKDRQVLSESSF